MISVARCPIAWTPRSSSVSRWNSSFSIPVLSPSISAFASSSYRATPSLRAERPLRAHADDMRARQQSRDRRSPKSEVLFNQRHPDVEGGKHGRIFETYDASANDDDFVWEIGKFRQPVGVYDVRSVNGN